MPTDNTLHLVAEEIELFEKLPADLKKKWKTHLKEETIDAYENPEEIKRKFAESRFEMPGGAEYLRKLATGAKNLPELDYSKLSDESWAEYFATIGASGASLLIQVALQEEGIDSEDMEGIAAMSCVRHAILKDNASKNN